MFQRSYPPKYYKNGTTFTTLRNKTRPMDMKEVVNGLTKVQAPLILDPLGPFAAGGRTILDPLDGTTELGRPAMGDPPS